jgi:protoporphyrin/coproporphyrin ferrochelatase
LTGDRQTQQTDIRPAVASRNDAVLLIAYGGPDRPEDVRPYLAGILRGRRVPPGRLEEVAHHYDVFGGRSPLTALTRRQAAALHAALAALGVPVPVYVGMRNWHPYLHETLAEMREAGLRRAFAIVMAPHRSYASWEQYQENVSAAQTRVGRGAPAIDYASPWFDRMGFIDAQADRIRDVLHTVPQTQRDAVTLLFTAHSIPEAMAARCHYAAEFEASARLVAARLSHPRWRLAYQSRSGDPREPWLAPDVNEMIRDLAAQRVPAVVAVPIGFVADHMEVLYDLDVEARQTARDLGIAYHRAGTVLDHPVFIGMLAGLVAAGTPARA